MPGHDGRAHCGHGRGSVKVGAVNARGCRVSAAVTSQQFQEKIRSILADESVSGSRIHISRNGHVYNCGDNDPVVYLVESGQLKTVTYSPTGKQCLLSIYAAGDILGELCFVSETRIETATAMRISVLKRIPVTVFRKVLREHNLLEEFLIHLALRLTEQQQIITNLVTMDSERRLAATLLMLGRKLGKRHHRGIRIDQRITQEELSGMVGTTRSRVGLFLKRFCDAGLVQRGRGVPLIIDDRSLTKYLEMSA